MTNGSLNNRTGVYSPKTPPRSIDLNMFNYEKTGIFTFPDNIEWEDTGEFTSPGWRSSRDFVGAILHPEQSTHGSYFHDKVVQYEPILFSFFKVVDAGTPHIVVFDGHRENGSYSICIEQGNDGYWYHCLYAPFPYNTPFPAYPILQSERARVIGFISACVPSNNVDQCATPSSRLITQFAKLVSPFGPPKELEDYIAGTEWEDPLTGEAKKLYFYPLNTTAVISNDFELPTLDR
eukprot:TRINITY_DN11474_c0_g1_i2.p1 TRINITY_DN11474_c0_g1~~TRINITY_DN11474_c0_g1_i2.p1  ORF type:complete len:235 (-),score=13.93 TRINITY_DN11474_c0_g1_i2:28-732(-)